jgi:4-hydroxyphenylpyruvate dioxygenase
LLASSAGWCNILLRFGKAARDCCKDKGKPRAEGRFMAPARSYSGGINRSLELEMPDLFDNPMGLCGFEFVEFTAPTPHVLEPVFEAMGFSLVARHRSKDVLLYRQGGINFIVNREPRSPAAYFGAEHGPSACGLAFRVRDSHKAYARAIELGAQPIEMPTGPMELRLPAIRGIGGTALYLIDRFEDGRSIYDIDFEFLDGVDRHPVGHGLRLIDHLTHNVYRGRMAFWSGFYERLFNFREIRHFDIQGEYTGLASKAMTAPDGLIRIPLNEESARGSGQIEEFLMQFNGEGIQHVALLTDDLRASVDALRMAGVPLMTAPNEVYYQMLEERLPGHGEDVAELQSRGILMDGSTAGGEKRLLLQIFSQTVLGPVFFEFIERRREEGFGEGNFKALFDSLERDQLRRGALQPAR